jgi:ubiquitin-like protein Pup
LRSDVYIALIIRYGARMAETTRKQKQAKVQTETDTADEIKPAVKGEKLISELDDLLDEIDEVLESNADEFVKNYVQKGGQ